jgi:hypothetical protein
MSVISNFELLLKPIAPEGGPATEVARVAVQGYFIQISNLESRDVVLVLRTRTPTASAGDSPNTEFTATNHSVVFDITQDNNFTTTLIDAGELIPGKQNGHSVNCIYLPAGQSGSIAILPNVGSLLSQGKKDLAIRGYAEIVLSSALLPPRSISTPITSSLLVSPDHRTTYLDPAFNPADSGNQLGLDFDQTVSGIDTANGMALQDINTYYRFFNRQWCNFTSEKTFCFRRFKSFFNKEFKCSRKDI